MRSVDELLGTVDPAWPELQAELAVAAVPVEVLPIEAAAGRRCLYHLQVTAQSRLGALALHTGGLLVEHGWLRVLGGGSRERGLPDLAEVNGLSGTPQPPPVGLLVGYDVLGGRYEINGPDPQAAGRPGARYRCRSCSSSKTSSPVLCPMSRTDLASTYGSTSPTRSHATTTERTRPDDKRTSSYPESEPRSGRTAPAPR